jgi:hypothetical protein
MCTVTIIHLSGGGYRVVHSRDEQRSRATGTSPKEHILRASDGSPIRAHWPIDPDAGGTWVASCENGLTHGILNVNIDAPAPKEPRKSRGHLIPPRILMDFPERIIDSLQSEDLAHYTTFRYFVAAPREVRIARWDGEDLVIEVHKGTDPICMASSGLGDELVQCRLPLFDELVRADPTPQSQDAYHEHLWPDRPEYSVMMSRKDARTVSIVSVEYDGKNPPMMSSRTINEGDQVCDPIGAAMLQ